MKNRTFAVALLALLMLTGAVYAEPAADPAKGTSVKTFDVKHRDANLAAAVVKPLLSAQGSMSMQANSNSIIVSDSPENLKAIAAAVSQFDVPAKNVRITVRLIGATKAAETPAVPDEVKDVATSLRMLNYNSFEAIGSAVVDGAEGQPAIVELGNGYRAEFRVGDFDSASNTFKIADFKVSRLDGQELRPVFNRTTLNLKTGLTFIAGATKSAQSSRALFVVATAR